MDHYDIVVIGAGIIGTAIAYGLNKNSNLAVAVVDESVGYKASLGNFGLIWLQSKGYKNPDYVRSSEYAVRNWEEYAKEIEADTGIDLQYRQKGGISFFRSEEEKQTKIEKISDINSSYVHESSRSKVLDREDMLKLYPHFGDKVIGGIYNNLDSHINPLYLLKAQTVAMQNRGVKFFANFKVQEVNRESSGYVLKSQDKVISCDKLVVSAGLGSSKLMDALGYSVPIRPQRGQILVTEKMPHLNIPTSLFLRQTEDATVTVGYSSESVGFDTSNDEMVIQEILQMPLIYFLNSKI